MKSQGESSGMGVGVDGRRFWEGGVLIDLLLGARSGHGLRAPGLVEQEITGSQLTWSAGPGCTGARRHQLYSNKFCSTPIFPSQTEPLQKIQLQEKKKRIWRPASCFSRAREGVLQKWMISTSS